MNIITLLLFALQIIDFVSDSISKIAIVVQSQPTLVENVLIGLAAGLISSLATTCYYRYKDNIRDSKLFQRNLINTVHELGYQLMALHLASAQVSDYAADFDPYYEKIRSIYKSRPILEKRFYSLPSNRKLFNDYKTICGKLHTLLNEYYRCMTVLSVYNREHLSFTQEELESRIRLENNKRYSTVLQLSLLSVDFLSLESDFKD